ncbi:hypothetical protein F5B18DRAFT_66239 [Nemania serpens]|nr:hypothetical protein F5B18DRAFT_66239 [Nemania serpens]
MLTANSSVTNTIRAPLYSRAAVHSTHSIFATLQRCLISPHNNNNSTITTVLPDNPEHHASNINNMLLPPPVPIITTTGLFLSIMACNASFCTLRNYAPSPTIASNCCCMFVRRTIYHRAYCTARAASII